LGPKESLAFFARAHEVPLAVLLQELQEASIRTGEPVTMRADGDIALADKIYRPFFTAGIAIVLTLGAAWGAYLLLRIAAGHSFASAGLHEINAHGHAQIFGWVGLFVMGFAYQAFPRFKHTSLVYPRLAIASLALMIAGVVGRCVLEPLAASFSGLAAPAVAASLLEVVAICIFVMEIVATWRCSGKPLAGYDYYILSSLAWFVIQAVYEAVYLTSTLAADRDHLVAVVATWQGALRDIQIHGFAIMMILGVSQRLFHFFYGFPEPGRRLSRMALWCLNVSVAGEASGLILMRAAGHAWAGLWYGSVIVLTGTITCLIWDWRLFSYRAEADRSLKFLRAAYAWLLVSLAMLVLLPAYLQGPLVWLAGDSDAARIGFSHAYYGAARHAITVGFISLMIVGVAARVVPTLSGIDISGLSPLWAPFILLNAGCALRVLSQTATDFTATAFPVAGLSGLLELLGLALWGVHLWLIMSGRVGMPESQRDVSYSGLRAGAAIIAPDRVGDILEQYPELLDRFVELGFKPLANPVLRKRIASRVTLEQACRLLGVSVEEVVAALNAGRDKIPGRAYPLPVVSAN
jgi:hypothetical protein